MSTEESHQSPSSGRVLNLFDCICIIVGTIIGAGIFVLPGVVANHLPSVPWFLGVWIFGGCIALLGALCFAELTTTYPDAGGDYGYLRRAYHPRLAFAFAWTAFWVIRPGNIGAMAMIFGKFAVTLVEPIFPNSGPWQPLNFAIGVVLFITALNGLGIVFSKTAQNLLTTAKVIGILLVLGGALALAVSGQADPPPETSSVVAGSSTVPGHSLETENVSEPTSDQERFASSGASAVDSVDAAPAQAAAQDAAQAAAQDAAQAAAQVPAPAPAQAGFRWSSFWMAMVFVMFVFGGWNDVAFVATEVEDPRRNLLKALVMGTLTVLAIYLLVNLSLLAGLGIIEMAEMGSRFENPTARFIERTIGSWGATLFSGLVCVSCLGSINAMIFTSPRIYWATARDYPVLSKLTGSSADRKGWRSMTLQCLVTILFMIGLGRRDGGIDNLVAATAPYFWLFLGLTVTALIINRIRHAGQFEGFRVPLYPLPPLVFITACGFMAFQAMSYLWQENLEISGLIIGLWVIAGLGLSFALRRSLPDQNR